MMPNGGGIFPFRGSNRRKANRSLSSNCTLLSSDASSNSTSSISPSLIISCSDDTPTIPNDTINNSNYGNNHDNNDYNTTSLPRSHSADALQKLLPPNSSSTSSTNSSPPSKASNIFLSSYSTRTSLTGRKSYQTSPKNSKQQPVSVLGTINNSSAKRLSPTNFLSRSSSPCSVSSLLPSSNYEDINRYDGKSSFNFRNPKNRRKWYKSIGFGCIRNWIWPFYFNWILALALGYFLFYKTPMSDNIRQLTIMNDALSNTDIEDRHRDTFVAFYRILGNDLPPRHQVGQTLINLHFILKHESPFPNCRKWWVLNRIVDTATEDAIIALLNKHGQHYLRIPYKESEYVKNDYRLDDFPEPDFFRSNMFLNFSPTAKFRTWDYTYHDKNQYVINNNGARNVALEHGRRYAKWVLPFDGNCFFTDHAWTKLYNELVQNTPSVIDSQYQEANNTSLAKYLIIPMARLTNNSLVLDLDYRPPAPEEPQVAFRWDAQEVFDETMRYGRRPKLELLWRLGYSTSGPQVNFSSIFQFPWERKNWSLSTEAYSFRKSSYVYRLFSGDKEQETTSRSAVTKRNVNRVLGVRRMLDRLDQTILNRYMKPEELVFWSKETLQSERMGYWTNTDKPGNTDLSSMNTFLTGHESRLRAARQKVLSSARYIFETAGGNVTESNEIIGSSNKRGSLKTLIEAVSKFDLETISKIDGAPFQHLQHELDSIVVLTLAWYFDGDKQFLNLALETLRKSVLGMGEEFVFENANVAAASVDDNDEDEDASSDTNTVTSPDTTNTTERIYLSGTRLGNVLVGLDFTTFLESLRILRNQANVMTPQDYSHCEHVFSLYNQLVDQKLQDVLSRQSDHLGTRIELQSGLMKFFVGDILGYFKVVSDLRLRIASLPSLVNATSLENSHEGLLALSTLVAATRAAQNSYHLPSSDIQPSEPRKASLVKQMGKLHIDLWEYQSGHPSARGIGLKTLVPKYLLDVVSVVKSIETQVSSTNGQYSKWNSVRAHRVSNGVGFKQRAVGGNSNGALSSYTKRILVKLCRLWDFVYVHYRLWKQGDDRDLADLKNMLLSLRFLNDVAKIEWNESGCRVLDLNYFGEELELGLVGWEFGI